MSFKQPYQNPKNSISATLDVSRRVELLPQKAQYKIWGHAAEMINQYRKYHPYCKDVKVILVDK